MAKGHRRFDGEMEDAVMEQSERAEREMSDSDDEDGAPEAVQSGTARREIEERERAERVNRESIRAAKRKSNKAREDARSGAKGKRRAKTSENVDTVTLEDSAPTASTSATTSNRLDPNLFLRASKAFEDAKESARLEEEATKNEQNKQVRRKKRKATNDEEHEQGLRRKVIGSTTIQQLATPSSATASTDPTTALPSSTNEAFLRNRLFKRKNSVFGRRSDKSKSTSQGKGKGKKEEKPFLLFDPLLDKAPEDKKANSKSRAATRMQMEERTRGRSKAVTAYSKANRRVNGPAIGFSVLGKSDAGQGRKRRENREKL